MDFLNEKQKKELNKKEWDVRPKGFYVTIYSDEMSQKDWEQVCQQADVDSDAKELTVLVFGVKTK